ncbi:YdcF family protein [Elioraea sp.]|uniref:YdcF family protein n=1 Tax=Elioraea sp. TaxID=2185103 RepID=UPI003F6F62D0
MAEWIVVFGFPVQPDGSPTPELARRIAAAALAARRFPQARVLVSGGPGRSTPAEATAMARRLRAHGIASSRIVEDAAARDTMDTVRAAARLIPRDTAVLAVTSAYHVPRCVVLLRIAGLRARGLGATAGRRIGRAHRLYWTARELPAAVWDMALALWLRMAGRLGAV